MAFQAYVNLISSLCKLTSRTVCAAVLKKDLFLGFGIVLDDETHEPVKANKRSALCCLRRSVLVVLNFCDVNK